MLNNTSEYPLVRIRFSGRFNSRYHVFWGHCSDVLIPLCLPHVDDRMKNSVEFDGTPLVN